MTRFSVVVPVYNVEKYLRECIESVLKQTHAVYELILVDDGSTDSSSSICRQYSQRHGDEIVFISNPNQGVFFARVCGAKRATGDFIIFLDSDDCLREDALAQLDEIIKNSFSDIIFFNASASVDFGRRFFDYSFGDGDVFEGLSKRELYKMLAHSSKLNSVCNKAIKRSLYEQEVCDLPKGIKYGEDLLESLRLLTEAERVVYLDQNLYFYRQREGSAVHAFDLEKIRCFKVVHLCVTEFINMWNMPELKPGHRAREVRGWVDLCLHLMANSGMMSQEFYHKTLADMATDRFFIEAYEGMDSSCLNNRQKTLALWFKNRRWLRLRMYVSIRKIKTFATRCK